MEPLISDDDDFVEMVNIVNNGLIRRRRKFRRRIDHFIEWTDEEFFDRFRISKNTAQDILAQINIGSATQRNNAVRPAEMLLLTLRYFATGSMLIVAGDFAGVHKSTASRIVHEVSRAIARLGRQYIKFPIGADDIQRVHYGFYQKARFPRCIGAIDCTHVKIQSPGGDNPEIYRNRKLYFSMNVQVVCDASLNIQNIVCRWPGSSHDATIFNNSRLRGLFEGGRMGDSVLVGDSGYGVRRYLMTPLRNPVTPAENLYNESQIRTRNPVERCFGVWKRRFPVLALGIRLNLQKVEAVVIATAVVHNIACKNGDPEPARLDEEMEAFILEMNNINRELNEDDEGVANNNNFARQMLIQGHFARLD